MLESQDGFQNGLPGGRGILCNFQNYLSQFQNYVSSDRREGRVECVAFDLRSRQDDVIYAIRGLENQGSWTASRRKVSRIWTDDDSKKGLRLSLAGTVCTNYWGEVRAT
jgi:hypothetical protein